MDNNMTTTEFHKLNIDKNLHIIYNKDGKSFEELLEEGITQVNLKATQKQIITETTPKKRSVADE